MNINYKDRSKPITAEDLIRRYNLDGLAKDRKAIQTNKNGLDKTDTLLNEFVESITKNLKELQDQVDGNITTWFFNGVPTNENQPANEWTSEEEKINHLGDLYYDQDTGYAYRWALIDNEYTWSKIVDADVVEALALANAAQDTADSKRRVFVEEPIPPYDVGDIWIKDDKDLYRCRSTRTSGNFANVDWILATDYSNDDYAKNVEAVLNQFKNDVQTNYVTEVKLETTVDSINANVKSNTEEIKNITQTTNEKEGTNTIYIEDAMETNAIEYNIKGKSEQDGIPTPDVPVEIKAVKGIRNEFDGLFSQGAINPNTGKVNADKQTWAITTTNLIKVKPNTTYTFSCKSNKQTKIDRVATFDKDKNFISRSNSYNSSSITIDSNTYYIRFNLYYPNNIVPEDVSEALFEEGTTVHSYVPYGSWLKTEITGRNKFDKTKTSSAIGGTSGYVSSDYIPVKNGDTIYKNNSTMFWFYSSSKENTGNATGSATTTISLENVAYMRCNVLETDIDTFMITINEEIVEYEPYKEKEVLVDLSKPNLFDNELELGSLSASGELVVSSDSVRTVNYIPIEPNTTYTISNDKNYYIIYYFYDSNKTYISSATGSTGKQVITTPSNCRYIKFRSSIGSVQNDLTVKYKLYEGYTDYYELSSIGDTKDNLEVVSGELTKKIGKVVLDGSETQWESYTENGDTFHWIIGLISATENYADALCSHFKNAKVYPTASGQFAIRGDGKQLSFRTSISSTSEWKTWLSENPVTVYYVLAEEETIQLTPTNIPLFEGVNNIKLIEDVETNTSINYFRNTPLSATYVTKSEMEASFDINNNSIEAKVTSKIDANYNKTQEQMGILANNTNNLVDRIEKDEENLANNYYSKENVEQLLITSSDGLTNTFSEAGGNNILKNTNFSANEVLEVGQVYEYWFGNVIRETNNSSVNGYSILLQNGNLNQDEIVPNGPYTLSFYYKKTNPLANVYVLINGKQYELTSDETTLFQTGLKNEDGTYLIDPVNVSDNHFKVEFVTNIDNSCEIYDIMANYGTIKLAYSQNANETITDTVNISKGITITSSTSEVKFTANNDGIRTKTLNDEPITEFTDKGLNTKEAVVEEEATIVGILRQRVGEQVWDSLI